MLTEDLEPFLHQIRSLPFVKRVGLKNLPTAGDGRFDGSLSIETPKGLFCFELEVRRAYLDRALTNAIIAMAQTATKDLGRDLLLLARYIPRLTGERLVDAGVNFLDSAGNIHLVLGKEFQRTILGHPELLRGKGKEGRPMTPAKVKLLFTFAAHPEAACWTVRELAAVAGVSKSKAAEARTEMIQEGVLQVREGVYRFRSLEQQAELLLSGYSQILRPRLLLNRFRSSDREPQQILKRLDSLSPASGFRYAVTGGAAAELLQHFYHGDEVPLFFSHAPPDALRQLKLLPDRNGAVIILRAFGTLPFWRKTEWAWIAHPWLIYAEMMSSVDPRAHEAAEELRKEYLSPSETSLTPTN